MFTALCSVLVPPTQYQQHPFSSSIPAPSHLSTPALQEAQLRALLEDGQLEAVALLMAAAWELRHGAHVPSDAAP